MFLQRMTTNPFVMLGKRGTFIVDTLITIVSFHAFTDAPGVKSAVG